MRQHAYCAHDHTKHSDGCDRPASGAFTIAVAGTSTGSAGTCASTNAGAHPCSNAGPADPKHVELDV